MAAYTSISGNQRPVPQIDPLGGVERGMSLSRLAMQNQRLGNQMQIEQKDQAYKDHMRKAQIFGQEMEGISGLDPAMKPEAYSRMRENLIQGGIATPDQLPPQYDPMFERAMVDRYRNSDLYLDRALTKAKIAKLNRKASEKPSLLESLTPGQKKADESFAKDASEYFYGGGKATVSKNIGRLAGAIDKLEANPDLTGGFGTQFASLFGDKVEDITNPEMVEVRDEIRSAIQGSLKQILGAQFTEKEAESMFSRAFNPRLSAEENVRRARSELNALKSMAAAKDDAMAYFERTGTLVGFQPGKTEVPSGRIARRPKPKQSSGGLEPEAFASGAGKVRVSNGKETYLIDLEDLPEAQDDGFEVVR